MKPYTRLVAFIESPSTIEEDRKKALTELNLLGIDADKIELEAYTFWKSYFEQNMKMVLSERLVLISHLLPDAAFRQCFDDSFQEFQNRRKDLGIDDIKKFWAP